MFLLEVLVSLYNIHELENFVKHVLFPKHELANIELLSLKHIWEADFGYIAFFVTPILDNWPFRR